MTIVELGHRYDDGPIVLDEISLTIDRGETVAFLGPSGSGKTTLLSIIGGMVRPTHGRVDMAGIPVDRRSPLFAWVFQTTNLLARRSVVDNVAIGRLQHGDRRDVAEGRASAALGRVRLQELSDRPAYTLSGGEAQRVGIARAITSDAPWILADEPTGQLDHQTSQQIGTLLVESREEHQGVIVATHDVQLAERCDRRYHIVNGRLRKEP